MKFLFKKKNIYSKLNFFLKVITMKFLLKDAKFIFSLRRNNHNDNALALLHIQNDVSIR